MTAGLAFRIESSSGVPITRQIADQIRSHIASGTLGHSQRLPSVRELARQLTVNQNTILRVYERLTAEGLLERRHGYGTFVADQLPAGQLKAQRKILLDELRRLSRRAQLLGVDAEQLHALLDRALREQAASPRLSSTVEISS